MDSSLEVKGGKIFQSFIFIDPPHPPHPVRPNRGMNSWIVRNRTVPCDPGKIAIIVAQSLPYFSSTNRAFFHKCLGRRSSCSRTMSPNRTFPDPLGGWEASWKFFKYRRFLFPSVSKRRLPGFVSFDMSLWESSSPVVLSQRVKLSDVRRKDIVQVSMRSRHPGLWASSSGRLGFWREWWPSIRLRPVTARVHCVSIFLRCLPSFPTSIPTKSHWE